MDWPWKKKSSASYASELSIAGSGSHLAKRVKESKNPKNVEISMDSFVHLTGLESQMKSYEEQVQALEDEIKELNERLSEADSEITDKENLVKQHTKVAEEAVCGWEKAEAEAAALKDHLETVTLQKLTAEDRAAQLDGALKECMRKIRELKEEYENKLLELALSKDKQFDKMKLALEEKLFNLDQDLLRAAAENAALSRSLQERSDTVIQLTEEKARAEALIERLKSNIELCEKELHSLKYEFHIARTEAEIRTEEKNMSVRSAEVANKQNLEGVKKIAKLEAECQRLRLLVRKKLPGPAAVAQMKLEVENLSRDYGDSRARRSPGRPPFPFSSQTPEFCHEDSQRYIKENELLTERLMVMEEEMKMVKESLAKRNSELQAARSINAITASKLRSLEAELEASGEQLSLLKSTKFQNEEVIDDNVSSAGSWSTGLLSEASHVKREKNVVSSPRKTENTINVGLMDDFLEMEKLACSVNASNGTVSDANSPHNRSPADAQPTKTEGGSASGSQFVEQKYLQVQDIPLKNASSVISQLQEDPSVLLELQSLISTVLESMASENDQAKVAEHAKHLIQGMCDCLFLQPEKVAAIDCNNTVNDMGAAQKEFKSAAARVCDFLLILAKMVPDGSPEGAGLTAKIDLVSAKYVDTMNSNINPVDFVLDISNVFPEASKLQFNFLGLKRSESEAGFSDCVDKIALPENKAVVDVHGESSDTSSDPDVPNHGSLVPTSESPAASSWKCSLEEFEQLKMEKDNLVADLARCMESLDRTKLQLQEMEHHLAEGKSQLSSSQKTNSLADTQLKCMAESYKSLEIRAEELQTEVNCLRARIESLENELQAARMSHQESLSRCKDLQEQLERVDVSTAPDVDEKSCQEKELADAAEKLAVCQETIFILGKQLKAMRVAQPEAITSLNNGRSLRVETYAEESAGSGRHSSQDAASFEMDTDTTSLQVQSAGLESSMLDVRNPLFSPDKGTSPKHQQTKHRPSSSWSAAPALPAMEKKAPRGFSRFFSSSTKGKQ